MGAGGGIYSNEEADNLSKHYGLDIVDQLSSMLSDELAKEIDKEIINEILKMSNKNWKRKESINKIFI